MDREKAADLLDNLIGMVEDSNEADYDTALKMGIEALSANGDTIYRQDAIDAIQPTEASCWGCNCPKMERLKEQKTFSEMVHLHDAETHEERTETHGVCLDTISRQMAIDAVLDRMDTEKHGRNAKPEEIKWTLERVPSAQPEPKWIPCSERLPEEHDSIFAKLYGTEKWRNAMFRKTSNMVIITVEFKDGTRQTAPCYTIDGEWNQSIKGMGNVVAWMPLPEPYKEKDNERA